MFFSLFSSFNYKYLSHSILFVIVRWVFFSFYFFLLPLQLCSNYFRIYEKKGHSNEMKATNVIITYHLWHVVETSLIFSTHNKLLQHKMFFLLFLIYSSMDLETAFGSQERYLNIVALLTHDHQFFSSFFLALDFYFRINFREFSAFSSWNMPN